MRLAAVMIVAAACGGSSSPAAPIGNRAAIAAAPRCPEPRWSFAPIAATTAADQCVHGTPSPWLVGDGAAPTCHVYRVTGVTSADEAITLADGRRVELRQSGCAHATFELRGVPREPFDRGDRAALIRAAVALLEDAAAVAPQANLGHNAAQLGATLRGGAAPTGSFAIGVGGDHHATVETVDGSDAIAVTIDVPL